MSLKPAPHPFWAVIHNVVAHPILGVAEAAHALACHIHDWTAQLAWPERPLRPDPRDQDDKPGAVDPRL